MPHHFQFQPKVQAPAALRFALCWLLRSSTHQLTQMLYHPDILDNSQNSPRKFTTTLLASQNIRTIKVSPYLIEVFLKTR